MQFVSFHLKKSKREFNIFSLHRKLLNEILAALRFIDAWYTEKMTCFDVKWLSEIASSRHHSHFRSLSFFLAQIDSFFQTKLVMDCIDSIEIITAFINCHLSPFNSIQFTVNPNFIWLWDQFGWALPKHAFYFPFDADAAFIHRFIHSDKNNDLKIMSYVECGVESIKVFRWLAIECIELIQRYTCVESFRICKAYNFPWIRLILFWTELNMGKWLKLAVHHDLIEIRSYRRLNAQEKSCCGLCWKHIF